jgi:hypothetical protein
VAAIYQVPDGSEPVIVGVDPAEFGRDPMAIEFIGARSWCQYAECSGQALDSETADTILWVLARLGVAALRRDADGLQYVSNKIIPYAVAVERQYGVKLIRELQRRKVALWTEVKGGKPGMYTSQKSRNRLFDALAEAIEGPDADDEGEPRRKRPTCDLRSKFLAAEVAHVIELEGRPDHAPGWHDDRVVALGIALYAAPSLRGRRSRGLTRRRRDAPRAAPVVRRGGPG